MRLLGSSSLNVTTTFDVSWWSSCWPHWPMTGCCPWFRRASVGLRLGLKVGVRRRGIDQVDSFLERERHWTGRDGHTLRLSSMSFHRVTFVQGCPPFAKDTNRESAVEADAWPSPVLAGSVSRSGSTGQPARLAQGGPINVTPFIPTTFSTSSPLFISHHRATTRPRHHPVARHPHPIRSPLCRTILRPSGDPQNVALNRPKDSHSFVGGAASRRARSRQRWTAHLDVRPGTRPGRLP